MASGISLHLGINRVDPNHYDGWDGELFGCENDARFYEAMAKDLGFETNSIFTEQLTTEHLRSQLAAYAEKLKPGDSFFLSYAGHGGSIPDLNGDEDDGRDETWLLYDRQFIDDELFEMLQAFQPGVKLLVFSDSCHSGSVVRKAEEKSLKWKSNGKEEEKPLIPRQPPQAIRNRTFEKNREIYDPLLKAYAKPEDVSSYVMLFAACADHETAKEWGDHGVFTGSVKRTFNGDFKDYSSLFNAIVKGMPAIQTPKLFRYGNSRFDFSAEQPFLLKGKIYPVSPVEKKPAEVPESKAKELIIHARGDAHAERGTTGQNADPAEDKTHYAKAPSAPAEKEWDQAYREYIDRKFKGESVVFAEPNIRNQAIRPSPSRSRSGTVVNNYLANWPQPPRDDSEFTWHLSDNFSQLRKAAEKARQKFGDKVQVRIAHIDTGYLDHCSKPEKLLTDLGVSFVKDEFGTNKGKDRLNSGAPAEQDGHGAATLAILAGGKISKDNSYGNYEGYFGAVPFAEVIPIRICETVYNFFNANDVADAIDYAVGYGCEVITMSMAGYPTKRVADAVNNAYENGVVVVTAAGNNWVKGFQKLTPKAIMYPARFERVIAATGACYNHEPYELEANSWYRARSEGGELMQGNRGPASAMKTALAAYTPNLPWAANGNIKFLRSGGGTSSATPQVAAAAAIWIAYNRDKIEEYGLSNSWKKVEAVRKALFRSASKALPAYKTYYGNGILRAYDALDNFDFENEIASLRRSPEARLNFGGLLHFVGQWFRGRSAADEKLKALESDGGLKEMLQLEIMQLIYRDPELFEYAESIEVEDEEGLDFLHDPLARKRLVEKIRASPFASEFLKGIISEQP